MTVSSGSQILASDHLKHNNANGELELNASTELTIAAGVIAPTQNFHRVDTEADAASDDLDTITLPSDASDGYILFLRAEHASRTVNIKYNTGNIWTNGGVDIILNDENDFAIAIYDSNLTKWLAWGHSFVFLESVFIGDTANASMTQGLTINQGAADDEILALKSSDVAHGMTDITETDTFAVLKKYGATDGGLTIRGYTEGTVGLQLRGVGTGVDATKDASATAAVVIDAQKKLLTGATNMTTTQNLLVIHDTGNARFIFGADGASHEDGAGWTQYDDYDDVQILETINKLMLVGNPIQAEFWAWAKDNREMLQRLGLITFNESGHHFINRSRMQELLVGAARQLGRKLEETNARLARLEQLLLPSAHLPKTAGAQ